MRLFTKSGRFLIAGILPGIDRSADDVVDKESKTYKSFLANKPTEETGLERLKQMLTVE